MKTVLRVIADELEATTRHLDQLPVVDDDGDGDILVDRLLTLRCIAEDLPPEGPGDVAILVALIAARLDAAYEQLEEHTNRASLDPVISLLEVVRRHVDNVDPALLDGFRKETSGRRRGPRSEPRRRAA
jgi:hypothetical protein